MAQRLDGVPEYYNSVLDEKMIAAVKRHKDLYAWEQTLMDQGIYYKMDMWPETQYVINTLIEKGIVTPAKRVMID